MQVTHSCSGAGAFSIWLPCCMEAHLMVVMSMQRTRISVRGLSPPWLGLDAMAGKGNAPSSVQVRSWKRYCLAPAIP